MIVTVYRSRCSIERAADGWHAVLWTEYRYDPRPAERRLSPAGWIHHRSGSGRVGADAEALHWLAGRGERHCRLAGEDLDVAKKRPVAGPSLFGDAEAPPATATAYPRAAHPPERPAENLTPASGQANRPDPPRVSSDGPADARPDGRGDGGGHPPGGPGPAAVAADEAGRLQARVATLAREVIAPERARWEERIAAATAYAERLAADRNRLMAALARARAQLGAAIAADDEREYCAGVQSARAILDEAAEAGDRPAA